MIFVLGLLWHNWRKPLNVHSIAGNLTIVIVAVATPVMFGTFTAFRSGIVCHICVDISLLYTFRNVKNSKTAVYF